MAEHSALVLGAGIIGLSVAWRLAQRGLKVTVLDRQAPGQGASQVAGGMLAPTCEAHDMPPALLTLAFAAARRWASFAAELEAAAEQPIGYQSSGTLWVARDRDELLELDHAAALQQRHGHALATLTAKEARRLAPGLHPSLAGGFHAHDDHHVDPEATCAALLRALARLGATVHSDAELCQLHPGPSGVRAQARDGRVWQAERAILATGAGPASLTTLPLRPVKGQILTLVGEPLLDLVVRTPRVYLIPRAGGRLVIGASTEELGFDHDPTAGVVMNLLREAWRVLPGVYDLRIERLGVGLRPALRDGAPAIGPIGPPQLIAALGHYRHGVLLAPTTADLIVASLLDGAPWPADFAPSRFDDGALVAPSLPLSASPG